jgi:hypothetical protein
MKGSPARAVGVRRPAPQLFRRVRRAPHQPADLRERQFALVAQQEDLAVIVRQPFQGPLEGLGLLLGHRPCAGSGIGADQGVGPVGGRIAGVQGDLGGCLALGRVAVAAGEVGEVIQQEPPQPGEQLLLGVAAKLREVAAGVEQRFLDQVGGTALGPQAGIEFLAGDVQQITAAGVQHPPQGFPGAGLGGREPLCRIPFRFGHGSSPQADYHNSGLQRRPVPRSVFL